MPQDDPIAKHPSPEGAKAPDEGLPIPFDLEADLGQIKAPGTKAAKEASTPEEKPKAQTAEEKKKAVEAEKKEKSRQAFLKAHPEVTTGAGLIARGAFATGAIMSREPLWNLTDEEERAIGKAWQPVIAIYGPEWLLKIFPVLGAVITTGQILASKSQQINDKKEALKEAKASKAKGEALQLIAEMDRARTQMEAARIAQDKQVSTAPQPEPKPKGG